MKKLKIIILFFAFVVTTSSTSFAFSGWNFIDGEFVYLNDEGKMLMDTFKESDGYMYYLDGIGHLTVYSMIDYGGYTYYVNDKGRVVKNDYVKIDETNNQNRQYEDGVYYFDENGRAYKRYGNDFIKNVNGNYQAFDENGKILVGWLDVDGNAINDLDSIFSDGRYFANGDGILMRNNWYKFSDDIGYYTTDIVESTLSSEKYENIDELWMYFDHKCKKVVSSDNSILSKNINGHKYGFDEYGIMLKGFTANKPLDVTTQASNPTLVDDVKVYDLENGDLLKNTWIKTVPSSGMSTEDNSNETKSWFYVGGNGNIVNNIFKTISGKKYAFDGIGRMKTEFIMFAEGKYKAQYKGEDLTREDFMYSIGDGGMLFGSDLCDLYYFGLPEDQNGDGSVITGDIKVELKDGYMYDFKFKKNGGKAYGSHTTLERHGDTYFINGLKLAAWDDTKYGVVKVSNNEYKVVNSNGKIQKSKRKLLKDDYDNYFVIFGDRLAGYIECPDKNIKIKWRNAGTYGSAGYYYYNNDPAIKAFTGPAVLLDSTCPTVNELSKIPKEERVNYK